MNTEIKRSTRRDLIFSLSILFATVTVIVLSIYLLSSVSAKWRAYRMTEESMKNYLDSKRYTLISDILLDLKEGSQLKQKQIFKDSGMKISLFRDINTIPTETKTKYCPLNTENKTNSCANYSNQIIRIWYPMQHSGTIYGYIIAEKSLIYHSPWLNNKTILIACLALLLIYFCVIAIVYRKIDSRMVRPLEGIIESLKPLSVGNYNINFDDYPSHEIDQVIQNLKIIIRNAKEARDRLVEYEKDAAIGRMAAQIAHDIRSPLSIVQYFIQSDRNKWKKEELITFSETSMRCLKKLTDMADELLNFSKANRVERSEVNFNTLITMVLQEAKAKSENDRIKFQAAQLKNPTIHVDASKINRVLTNLISNSIDAIPEKGTIMIDAVSEPSGITISLKDTGKGIAAEHISKIFDNTFTHGKKKGTGLGLAYCQNVIKAHGGQISVMSELGKGTKFVITIPKQGCDLNAHQE